MLQYTAGYYVNMQSTGIRYAIAIPINATWVSEKEGNAGTSSLDRGTKWYNNYVICNVKVAIHKNHFS